MLVREDSVFIDSTNSRLDSLPVRDSINWNCFGWEGNPWGYYYGTDSFPDFVSRGFWEYTQIIKVIDTIAPTIFFEDSVYYCMNLPNCSADVAVSFAIVDECVDGNVEIKTYFEGITNEFETLNVFKAHLELHGPSMKKTLHKQTTILPLPVIVSLIYLFPSLGWVN